MIHDASDMDAPLVRVRGLTNKARVGVAGVVVAVALLALSAPAISRWAAAERAVDIAHLRLGRVTRGDLQRDLAVTGTVVAAFHPRLFSPADGMVSLKARAGEVVARGQVLAEVASPELESRLEQEGATLQSLRSDLARQEIAGRRATMENEQNVELIVVRHDAAVRDLDRAQRLSDEGLLNKADLERARDGVTVATVELRNARRSTDLSKETLEVELHNGRLQIERQESVVKELQRRVELLRIPAPFDGMVATVDVEDRDAVVSNQPLLTVVDLSTYEVQISIPEGYADDVVAGTPAQLLVGGTEHPGAVTAVSPEVRESEVEGTVVFTGPPPEGLKQNQRIGARLILDRRRDVLKVPRGPFLESGGGRRVYVVQDGLARLREVAVGAVSVSEVEIVSGLEEGEEIVLSDVARFEGASTVLVRR